MSSNDGSDPNDSDPFVSWKALQQEAKEDSFLNAILNHEGEGAIPVGYVLEENQQIFHFAEFLKFWYATAECIIDGKMPLEQTERDIDSLMMRPEKPLSKIQSKYYSLLKNLGPHHSKLTQKRNLQVVWDFLRKANTDAADACDRGIFQDIESCELNIRIREFADQMRPEYSALQKKAFIDISRYQQDYQGKQFKVLEQSVLSKFCDNLLLLNSDSYFVNDEKQSKRFMVFRTILEKLSRFVHVANRWKDGSSFLSAIDSSEDIQSSHVAFLKFTFKLVSICFVVINQINEICPLLNDLLKEMNPVSWQDKEQELKENAEDVRKCLATTLSEATTRWLQSEISGYCHDVCQDSLSAQLKHGPATQNSQHSPAKGLRAPFTGISRSQHLAVDTHPECQDLIGMQVWYLDSVPTGGFNQYLSRANSTCGVMIVHVFLRYNIAIPRLRDHPERMQGHTANNDLKNNNVQLPSWLHDACVSDLFYQPLLDFLIQDFALSLERSKREPVRLVFTGSALDAVLATIVASELLFRFNSYREDPLIKNRHSHDDWDILYKHIQSSVFVLSFMLPAVFSGPHISPHQISARRHGMDQDKQTLFDAIGINMLNITVSNCMPFKLIEYWLSVDRKDYLAKHPSEWKNFLKYDRIIVETLQKLFSWCEKTPELRKAIDKNISAVKIWAQGFESQRALAGFVADYKSKAVAEQKFLAAFTKPEPRLINSEKSCKCQTLAEKTREKTVFGQAGHAAAGLFTHHENWWFGCLELVKEPFKLLSWNHHLPSAAREVMDVIASWFLPVAKVHEHRFPCQSLNHRQVASYGTLNASDVVIPEIVYNLYGLKKKDKDTHPFPTPKCMHSRLSLKPNCDSSRLLIQWNCDSMDSDALIRNCFAVTLRVCFDPNHGNMADHHDERQYFDFQTVEFSNSDLRVTVTMHDNVSIYALQFEAEVPIPAYFDRLDPYRVIDSTIVYITMRMRFFSAQFGCIRGPYSASEGNESLVHVGHGPELFCFPECFPERGKAEGDGSSPQPDRVDNVLLLWFWFYLCRCPSTLTDDSTKYPSDVKHAWDKLKEHFDRKWTGSVVSLPRHFRKVLKLDEFYNKHDFYSNDSAFLQNAFDITFCEFGVQKQEEKLYNSRYLHMRLDELIMQFWDFKLLALNAFGKHEDLQKCKFDEGDALIHNFDEQCDLFVSHFRGSTSSSKFSKPCGACEKLGREKIKRSACKLHMYDHLNDDEEGLEYLRKQSSYLRRLTFPKAPFKRIVDIFKEQAKTDRSPPVQFYKDITKCVSAISDPSLFNVKLVAAESSYDGIFNALFYHPMQSSCTLSRDDAERRDLSPRFPIDLYDNEMYKLAHQQDYCNFPTAPPREGQPVIPACSLISKQSSKLHHFRFFSHVLEQGLQKEWNSHRTEAEFTSWAHGMGVLRSFAIRKEFESFCSFFKIANERRPALYWLSSQPESADPYLDCLLQIHDIFGVSLDSSDRLKYARDGDYHAYEERIIRLICGHDKFGYGSRECFKKDMMSEGGRILFQQKVSLLPGVRFLEMLAFFFFRGNSFWASWVTNFVRFMFHIHQLRDWLMENKRCVAAFGVQKVGKSRFWKNSLGIETNPSGQSNTVQTQMWMLPYSQFIDFPAFSEENKLGESYNIDRFIRCDMLARDIVYDFLLVPDVCVYIAKIDSPNTTSIKPFMEHIENLEMNRYPSFYDQSLSRSGLSRAGGYNRLARESFLLCSHTQNFISRMQPVRSEDGDRESLTAAELRDLTESRPEFAWVCGGSDGFDEMGHAVKIIEKIQVDGTTIWKVVASERDVWQRLRTKLGIKKRTISEIFPNKNVFLAYFAEYQSATGITPYSRSVVNHIDEDFPWSSAFCESTGNLDVAAPRESDVDADSCYGDLPVLNASQSLEMIMRKMFTEQQLQLHKLDDVIARILLRPTVSSRSPDQRTCDVCVQEDYSVVQFASMQCNECNWYMCSTHTEQHRSKRASTNHRVVNIAELRRQEEEITHPNSRKNRESMRLKIWHFQQQHIAFRGQTMIDELCADAGLIKTLLKSLKHLRGLLAFDLSAFESSNSFGIGLAFWSYLMGDEISGRTFCEERIKWRSVETFPARSAKTKRISLDLFSEPYHQTPEDLMQKFILDVNTLWNVVKRGETLTSEISKFTAQDSQKMHSSAGSGSGTVHGTKLSSDKCRVVPWFSAIFFRMLQEGNFPDLVVVFDGLRECSNGNLTNRPINSQEFCMALIKIILLPMLASKKCANSCLTELQELQYGDGSFFSSFFYLEKAMFKCRDSRIISNRRHLVDLFCIQSASEDQTTQYIETISLLLRCVTVKGLIELSEAECLDFQPCIPNLACEHMYRILCESRSTFAFNYSLLFAGTSGSTSDQLLQSMIQSTELAFVDKMESWVLKPMLEIQAKIGRNWRSVCSIASKEKFKDVFEITRTIGEQYGIVKRRMHDLAYGSYAAVTVSIHKTLSTDLNNPSMSSDHYFDIPLMGRTLMGIGNNGIVQCFLTEPSICYFECKVQCCSFNSANETYKERQFLRISFDTLRSMKIEKLSECSNFTFILSNCSTVFFEELHPQAAGDRNVIWTDLSLVKSDSSSHYPRPFHDCKVELKPLISEESAFAREQLSEFSQQLTSKHCIVGQRVMMHISFRLTEPLPIRQRTRILVVLDNDFDYTTPKSPSLMTIFPFNKETAYVITDKGTHALMEVWFNPGDEVHKGCVTLSFPAKNPCGERLSRRACFIYLRNEYGSDEPPHFILQSSTPVCLGCGIASTPEIRRMPLLMNSEILISKALLSANNVDLMLTFECSVDFLLHHPASNLGKLSTSSIIEINFPKSWDFIAKDGQPHALTLRVPVNGVQTDLPVELHEFSHNQISVRIKQEECRDECRMSEGGKCLLLIQGIRLPPQSDEFRIAYEHLKEAIAELKEKKAAAESLQNDQSQADYEDSQEKIDNARSQLNLLKEKLTSGCSVTIRDASQCIVMTGHNVSMSPFFDDEQQFATTIQRKSFEESEFQKAYVKGCQWGSVNTSNFWTRFNMLMDAFMKQHFSSETARTHSGSLDAYKVAIDEAFAAHVQSKVDKSEPVQDRDPASRVAALAIQLWSAPHFLEIENERWAFHQIMNRFVLSEDSKALLDNGGIDLILAMKKKIVVGRSPPASPSPSACGGVSDKSDTAHHGVVRAVEMEHSMYFRGSSVPFEMAGFFFPGKIFRFPAFLATSLVEENVFPFLLLRSPDERTLWKISVPSDCKHANVLKDSLVMHEKEFLFAPYCTFIVISNRRETIQSSSSKENLLLRVICLQALSDNQAAEAQNVPTAPRY